MNTGRNRVMVFLEEVDPKGVKLLICTILSLVVQRICNLFYPLPSAILMFNTAYIVTQMNLDMTRKGSSERMIGTLMSAALGLVTYYLLPGHILVLPICITLSVFISYLFFKRYISAIVFITIMVVFYTLQGNVYNYLAVRIVNTVLGIAIAILVTTVYTHPVPRGKILSGLQSQYDQISGCADAFLNDNTQVSGAKLYEIASQLKEVENRVTDDAGLIDRGFYSRITEVTGELIRAVSELSVLEGLAAKYTGSEKERSLGLRRDSLRDHLARADDILQELNRQYAR